MKKTKILCIIGASGSGKTTIEKMLSEISPNTFGRVVSYTTRPMREGEHDGDEHFFVSQSYGEKFIEEHKEDVLASTEYGGYYYWAGFSSLEDNKINTYVIDVEGYRDMMRRWGNTYDIKVLYVKRPNKDGIDVARAERDKGREQLTPDEIDFVFDNNRESLCYLYLTLQKLSFLVLNDFTFPHINDANFTI